jgi:hypothetical protein
VNELVGDGSAPADGELPNLPHECVLAKRTRCTARRSGVGYCKECKDSMDSINCVCVLRVPKILVASVGLVL